MRDYEYITDKRRGKEKYYQDVVRELGKKKWKYKTEKGLRKRLEQLAGVQPSAKLVLKDPAYGIQVSMETLPGDKGGYVPINTHIARLNREGVTWIEVEDYYSPLDKSIECIRGITIKIEKR